MNDIAEREVVVLGEILCGLGIHRWEYQDIREGARLGTYARCRRRCRHYYHWAIVNIDLVGGSWR